MSDLDLYSDGRAIGADQLEAYQVQLELVHRELAGFELFGEDVTDSLRCVRGAISELQLAQDEDNHRTGYQASAVHTGSNGRPRFHIPRNQLATLLETLFTVPQIAGILGVSTRTVQRRMTDYSLSITSLYSDLNDDQLDRVVEGIVSEFPMCGNRQMQGHLLARGIRVQQHRIGEAQRRVDPAGTVMRRLRTIQRREYHVNGPLALWHIDGNHKLIR